ncbi:MULTISPECIES: hypothetical protein [unclassified Curtobacterium]|uniref:hypothetical protein n=1 Tax=unclassified Curtobacterium TaxID=257496 RepID=UPI003826F96A
MDIGGRRVRWGVGLLVAGVVVQVLLVGLRFFPVVGFVFVLAGVTPVVATLGAVASALGGALRWRDPRAVVLAVVVTADLLTSSVTRMWFPFTVFTVVVQALVAVVLFAWALTVVGKETGGLRSAGAVVVVATAAWEIGPFFLFPLRPTGVALMTMTWTDAVPAVAEAVAFGAAAWIVAVSARQRLPHQVRDEVGLLESR